MRYGSVYLRVGHPLRTANSPNTTAQRLRLFELLGPGPYPCHWCDKPVDWMPGQRTHPGALVVDHVDMDRFNNSDENLVPSCQGCNVHRNRPPAYQDKRTCARCGTPFVVESGRTGPRMGMYCSRRCTAFAREAAKKAIRELEV